MNLNWGSAVNVSTGERMERMALTVLDTVAAFADRQLLWITHSAHSLRQALKTAAMSGPNERRLPMSLPSLFDGMSAEDVSSYMLEILKLAQEAEGTSNVPPTASIVVARAKTYLQLFDVETEEDTEC
jgi:hypothetical protein